VWKHYHKAQQVGFYTFSWRRKITFCHKGVLESASSVTTLNNNNLKRQYASYLVHLKLSNAKYPSDDGCCGCAAPVKSALPLPTNKKTAPANMTGAVFQRLQTAGHGTSLLLHGNAHILHVTAVLHANHVEAREE
jgi:hypothetical protein